MKRLMQNLMFGFFWLIIFSGCGNTSSFQINLQENFPTIHEITSTDNLYSIFMSKEHILLNGYLKSGDAKFLGTNAWDDPFSLNPTSGNSQKQVTKNVTASSKPQVNEYKVVYKSQVERNKGKNFLREQWLMCFGMAIACLIFSFLFAPTIAMEEWTTMDGVKMREKVEKGSGCLSILFKGFAWGFLFLGLITFIVDFLIIAIAIVLMVFIWKVLYKHLPKLSVTAVFLILVLTGIYAWKTEFSSLDWKKNKENLSPPQEVSINPTRFIGDSGKYKLTIIAVHDKLSPIRITVDEDLRRPYWIEHGESIQFSWNKRIIIDGNIPVTQIALEGFVFNQYGNEDNKIAITDSLASSFLQGTLSHK